MQYSCFFLLQYDEERVVAISRNGTERNGTELRSIMRNGAGLKYGTRLMCLLHRFTVVLCTELFLSLWDVFLTTFYIILTN